jgi:arylsulfatase A-like enzyme
VLVTAGTVVACTVLTLLGCAKQEPPVLEVIEGSALDLLSHPFTTLDLPRPEGDPDPARPDSFAITPRWDDGGFWRLGLPAAADPTRLRTLRFRYTARVPGVLRLGVLGPRDETPTLRPLALRFESSAEDRSASIAVARELMPCGPLTALTLHPPVPQPDAGEIANVWLVQAGSCRVAQVTLDGRTRRALVLDADSGAAWRVRVPPGGHLDFGYGVQESAWHGPGDGSFFQVEVVADGHPPVVVWEDYLTPKHDPRHRTWRHAHVDLAAYAGRAVTLRLLARASPPTHEPFATRHDARDDAPVVSAPRIMGERSAHPNVVLILVDTLREDGLGAFRTDRDPSPHLDDLVDEAAVFERAYATAPWTHPSTGSLLTGLLPPQHGLGTAPAGMSFFRPQTVLLAELFHRAGYATATVSNNLIVSPDEGFARGVDSFDTRSLDIDQYFGAERVTRGAMEWLDEAGDAPFFLYLHYFDPHDRYQAPLPYTRAFVTPALRARVKDLDVTRGRVNPIRNRLYEDGRRTDFEPSTDTMEVLRGLYDGEIQYVDAWIGRLLRFLQQRGRDRDTIVVLTADHGEEFLDHDYLKHGQGLYDELIHVPLVMRFPDGTGRGRRIASPVSLIDVVPTLLAACGLSDAARYAGPGRDLYGLLARSPADDPGPVFAVSYGGQAASSSAAHGPKHAVIDERWKLIHTLETDEVELFDLERDPREQRNVAGEHPQVVDRLRALADSTLAAPPPAGEPAAPMNRALLEKLEALGYVH